MTAGGELYFSIRADPAPRTDLTVGVTVSSSPTGVHTISYGGCKVARSSEPVTIAAGDSSTPLEVPTSGAAGCTVTATIADGQGYRVGRSADASAAVDVTGSTDLPPPPAPAEPVVTIAADRSSVVEGEGLSFTVTAAPPPASALEVTVSWSDPDSFLAESVPRTVTVPTSSSTVKLRAATTDDSADEPDGVVTATISGGSGYTIGSPASAPVTVTDNDASTTTSTPPPPPVQWKCPPESLPRGPEEPLPPWLYLPERPEPPFYCSLVSIRADVMSVTEGDDISFELTAEPAPESDLTVSLSWGANASRVGARPSTVTIAAGSSTASFTVQTIDNSIPDGTSRCIAYVTPRAASESNPYGLETPTAKVEIEDNDDP